MHNAALIAAAPDLARLALLVPELREALNHCVTLLEATLKEHGRQVEWGEEDPFRMGEWFEDDDCENVRVARAALAKLDALLEGK